MTMAQWNQKYMPKVDTVPVRQDEVPGIPITVLQYPLGTNTEQFKGDSFGAAGGH